MPPKPKRTKEEVINAALQLVRNGDEKALTAKNIGASLGIAPSSIFTHFSSMKEVQEAVIAEIRKIYEGYVNKGLSMNPPFKGFGVQFIRFAADEPRLFLSLFVHNTQRGDLSKLIRSEGHEEIVIRAISESLRLDEKHAKELYQDLWMYLLGIATMTAAGLCSFSEEELSYLLGKGCRAFLISGMYPQDERIKTVPGIGIELEGTLESYLILEQDNIEANTNI